MSAESIGMGIFGFVVLYGGLFYFLRIAMKSKGL
jgi:hypothetical protein